VSADAAHVVVADGGGGIPVARRGDLRDGVDAVIDKDYTAAELAHHVDADALVLVIGVDSVMLEFGTDSQRWPGRIDGRGPRLKVHRWALCQRPRRRWRLPL